MKIFWKICKIIAIIISLLGIVSFGSILIETVQKVFHQPQLFLSFCTGGIAFSALWFFLFSKKGYFWSTLEHELTHAIFALIFFKKIHSISASRKKGGLIKIDGGNAVIALSPYFFPLACMPILLLKGVFPNQYQIFLNFLMGFTYFFHLLNLFKELHLDQSDIISAGYLFSIIIIIFMNIIFLEIILLSLSTDWLGIYSFFYNGVLNSVNYFITTVHYLFYIVYTRNTV